MSVTHPLFRKFKQVVEAGIVCADDETFVVEQKKFLRLLGASEVDWEHLRQLNAAENEYALETTASDFIFTRPPETDAQEGD